MAASFSAAACPVDVGLTDAENLVEEKLNLISNRADQMLQLGLALESQLSEFAIPSLGITFSFDGSGQLDTFDIPDRPAVNANDLVYVKPEAPSAPNLQGISDFDPDTNFPSFNSSFLTSVISKLTTMLTSAESLPTAWVEANWASARDRLSRDEAARVAQVQGEFSRRGWASPSGVETSRVDAIRNEFVGQLSALNRDIAIKVYEEALVSLRLAAQLGIEYLRAWVQAYAAYIDAVSEESQNEIRRNAQLLQKLEAALRVFDAERLAEDSRIDAVLRKYGLDFQAYNSDLGLRTSLSQRDQAKYAQETERRRIQADVAIQDNQARLQARAKDITEQSENLRSRSDIVRQIGAALWQAVNVGASTGISYGRSRSSSCATNFSYSESA